MMRIELLHFCIIRKDDCFASLWTFSLLLVKLCEQNQALNWANCKAFDKVIKKIELRDFSRAAVMSYFRGFCCSNTKYQLFLTVNFPKNPKCDDFCFSAERVFCLTFN